MSVRVLAGPAGSGKTARLLTTFRQFKPSEHRNAVRLIVPSTADVLSIRRLLLSDPGFPGFLGDPVCTFDRFSLEILAGTSPHVLTEFQRRVILSDVIESLPPACFSPARNLTDFVDELARTVAMLKRLSITSEDLRTAVHAARRRLPEHSKRKILDLACLLDEYHKMLAERKFLDPSDLPTRAADAIRRQPDLPRRLKIAFLDGFTSLAPGQVALLRLMAKYVPEIIIALDSHPANSSGTEDLLDSLHRLPQVSIEHCEPPGRADALDHLRRHLFDSSAGRTDADESVTFLVGGLPEQEIELVCEEIRRLLHSGYNPRDICVAARSMDGYSPCISRMFARYGIPVGAHRRQFTDSKMGRWMLDCTDPPTSVKAFDQFVSAFPWPQDEDSARCESAAYRSLRRIIAEIEGIAGQTTASLPQLLRVAIQSGSYRVPEASPDCVSLLDIAGFRGQKYRAVFVVGMLDGGFPRRMRGDPFLNERERSILNPCLPHPLELHADQLARERGLFVSAVAAARDRLYLSYPLAGASGQDGIPSRFLEQVEALLSPSAPTVVRDSRDPLPAFDRACTVRSLVSRLILDSRTASDPRAKEETAAVYNLLLKRSLIGPHCFVGLGEDYSRDQDSYAEADSQSE